MESEFNKYYGHFLEDYRVDYLDYDDEAKLQNRQKIQSYLRLKIKDPVYRATLMATFDKETGGTFDYRTRQIITKTNKETGEKTRHIGDKRKHGYGLFQMGLQKDDYGKWLENYNRKDSFESQIDYWHQNVYDPPHSFENNKTGWKGIGRSYSKKQRKLLKEQDTIEGWVEVFTNNIVKPGKPYIKERKAKARKYYAEEVEWQKGQPDSFDWFFEEDIDSFIYEGIGI